MRDSTDRFTTRAATSADAAAIAEIYNEGIADRVATFETEPRAPSQIAEWFRPGVLVVVAEKADDIVAFAASFPYSPRPCYAGIAEYSVYVARDRRGQGWTAAISTPLAVFVLVLWNAAIYLDSSALTAGTVQAADPKLRGATMGLHSMCGYAGGFIGPPLAGFVLDFFGRDSIAGWGLAFGHLAVITMTGFALLLRLSGSRASRVPASAVSAD